MKYIAEIGVNHLGDEEKARRMVESCIEAGVDAVTFQIQTDDYYDNSRPFRKRLSESFYLKTIKYVHNSGKEIGIALAEPSQVNIWAGLGIDFWKVLSMDFYDKSMISSMQNTRKDIYISTGVSSLEEIKELYTLFNDAWYVHTTLQKSSEDSNLSAIKTMRSIIGSRVGYGMHCPDPEAVYFSIAYGASFAFIYVREDDDEYYPDYEHSIKTNVLKMWLNKWSSSKNWIGTGNKNKQEIPEWVYE